MSSWKEEAAPFVKVAGELLGGALIFALLALAATGLHFFIVWLGSLGTDPVLIWVLKALKYLFLAFDVVFVVLFLIKCLLKALREVRL